MEIWTHGNIALAVILRGFWFLSQVELSAQRPTATLERRGAVIDRQLGHVLVLTADGEVARAVHGQHSLSAAEIATAYADARDELAEFQHLTTARFWCAGVPVRNVSGLTQCFMDCRL